MKKIEKLFKELPISELEESVQLKKEIKFFKEKHTGYNVDLYVDLEKHKANIVISCGK